jgi:hypothetical protein
VEVAAIVPTAVASAQPATQAAVAPQDKQAYIFSTFGNPTTDLLNAGPYLAAALTVGTYLHGLHYSVKSYVSSTEGARDNPGDATLDNFAKMAGYDGSKPGGVIIIDTHGDPNGLAVEVYATASAALAQAQVYSTKYPGLITWNSSGYPTGGLVISSGNQYGGTTQAPIYRYALSLTLTGVNYFFHNQTPALVYVAGCEALGFSSAFHAESFLGYPTISLAPVNALDETTFFGRMAGMGGLTQRTTTGAASAGYASGLQLVPGSSPVTLAPAVSSTSPAAGSVVGGGGSSNAVNSSERAGKRLGRLRTAKDDDEQSTVVPGSVQFDTEMDTSNDPNKVISVSGCGAKLQKGSASWGDDGSSLSFNFTVPQDATGTATLTVSDHKAEAESEDGEGPNDFLDGNQSPSPANGEAPNDSDYQWTLNCAGTPPPPTCSLQPPQKPTLSDIDFATCWLLGSQWIRIYTCSVGTGFCADNADPGLPGTYIYPPPNIGEDVTTLDSVDETTGTIEETTFSEFSSPTGPGLIGSGTCTDNSTYNVYTGYGTGTYSGTATGQFIACGGTETYQGTIMGNGYVPPCPGGELAGGGCSLTSSANKGIVRSDNSLRTKRATK